MKQYQLTGNELKLAVKKAPIIVRSFVFLFAFLCFVLPLAGVVFNAIAGNGFRVGFLFGLVIFGLLGFYLLRVSLWNTYGNEIILFSKNHINYVADYGWFKDGKKQIETDQPIVFAVNEIGYKDEKLGQLSISTGDHNLICVTKMPTSDIEELIVELSNANLYS